MHYASGVAGCRSGLVAPSRAAARCTTRHRPRDSPPERRREPDRRLDSLHGTGGGVWRQETGDYPAAASQRQALTLFRDLLDKTLKAHSGQKGTRRWPNSASSWTERSQSSALGP